MDFYFLDESGDSGAGGSKFLVNTLVSFKHPKKVVKIIKKTKQRLLRRSKGAKWLKRRGGEIKFYGFPDKSLLCNVLEELSALKPVIVFIAIEKQEKRASFGDKTLVVPTLFEYLTKMGKKLPEEITADLGFCGKGAKYLAVDRYKVVEHTEETGETYLDEVQMQARLVEEWKWRELREEKGILSATRIRHVNSRVCEELQAVDLISGAIFQSVENSNPEFADHIRKRQTKIMGRALTRR